MFNIEGLKSGIKLIYSEMKDIESVSLGFYIQAGSRYENKSQRGISHFLEHMVFKGTRKYSSKKIKNSIEGVGGYINAFTSKEVTCFYIRVVSKYQRMALDILLDMITSPLLREEDIEKEKKVIEEEIKTHFDLPHTRCLSLLEENIFKGESLGYDILGTKESISRIKRRNFLDYKDTFYRPHNMILSCCGHIDLEFIKRMLEEKLEPLSKKKFPLRGKRERPSRFVWERRDISQVHISLGTLSLSYSHPQRFIQDLVHIILGANMSSRLFERIRERRGLVYEISTFLRRYRDKGLFGVYLATSRDNAYRALSLIFEELKNISRNLKDKEVSRSKEYLWGQTLLGLESPLERMAYLGEQTIYLGRPLRPQELKEKIFSVERKDIVSFIKEYLRTERFSFSLVGDIEEKDVRKFLKSFL